MAKISRIFSPPKPDDDFNRELCAPGEKKPWTTVHSTSRSSDSSRDGTRPPLIDLVLLMMYLTTGSPGQPHGQ